MATFTGALISKGLSWPGEWYQREPTLAKLTIVIFAVVPFLLLFSIIDERTINEINVWRKPLKFHVSTVLFTGTLVWYCGWIDRKVMTRWWYRMFTCTVVFCVTVELVWLTAAAVMAEPSHFNRSHSVLSIVYPFMGIVAVTLTSATLLIAILIVKNRHVPLTAYLKYTVITGLFLSFLLTVIIAGELASMESHWIGGTQSDKNGLPLFGWSRDGGDLRVAHFFSLHAMQILPLLALFPQSKKMSAHPGLATSMLSLFYVGFVLFVYFQAKQGLPFIA